MIAFTLVLVSSLFRSALRPRPEAIRLVDHLDVVLWYERVSLGFIFDFLIA